MWHHAQMNSSGTGVRFAVSTRLAGSPGRTGVLTTPHGQIRTPAFIPVGTAATVKGVLPDQLAQVGAQAVLANAYHLYLRPGADVVAEAGGVGAFMAWPGVTFTDSGGFQVLSLGAGYRKVLALDAAVPGDRVIAPRSQRLAVVDDDGVTFRSHLDGSRHRFTPESSIAVQHQLGADIIFAFDECTTLLDTRAYQEASVARTAAWARRCLTAHRNWTMTSGPTAHQGLFGVVQGAQFEDLRRGAARDLAELGFDGFGIGGALEKENLGRIVRWVCEELPEAAPRHLLGIAGIDDLFLAVAQGADTFDCVAPSRTARHGRAYTPDGPLALTRAARRREFGPIDPDCPCSTCAGYSRAYLHHLLRAKEIAGATLVTIHNLHFVIHLVSSMREAIETGGARGLDRLRDRVLSRYFGGDREV
jgi:queuine tRNA-ribosyltransferase